MQKSDQQFTRSSFTHIIDKHPRWSDYDMLGHLNNVQFYRFFEFTIIDFLKKTPLDWLNDPVIPYVVENRCFFRRPIPYGSSIQSGLRVKSIGRSSVHFELALFINEQELPCAYGYFIHVYILRETEKATPVPEAIARVLRTIQVK